ncbi:hypothetical protein Btru_054021 [Bulinus truncatus]|nr:hypothetical protein Btru_054021 [Bulinus truncatus]
MMKNLYFTFYFYLSLYIIYHLLIRINFILCLFGSLCCTVVITFLIGLPRACFIANRASNTRRGALSFEAFFFRRHVEVVLSTMFLHTAVLLTTGLVAAVTAQGAQFLDCPGNTGKQGIYKQCCTSDQLPKGCECYDISPRSFYTNTQSNKPRCPADINVSFNLYTRANRITAQMIRTGSANINRTSYNGAKKTVFIAHGFVDSGVCPWCIAMKNVLLDDEDMNVVVVDWQEGAKGPVYLQAAANTRTVGSMVGRLILDMNSFTNSDFGRFHLIGFSLGAHIMGYAGKEVFRLTNQKVGRITGLDPAGPAYSDTSRFVRLDSTDGLFVDIIHTNSEKPHKLGFGITHSIGHVDFYPNGGEHQPGCPKENLNQIFTLNIKETRITCTETRITCTETRITCTETRINCTETRITCTKTRITCTETRITCTETRITCTETRITCTETRINCTDTRITCTETRITCTETRITCTETRITCTDTRITCTEIRITCTEIRITCTKTRITCTKTRITCTETRITCTETRITCTETRITCTKTRITCTDTRITCTETRITCTETRITCTETRITCTETRITCTETRITCTETRITCTIKYLFFKIKKGGDPLQRSPYPNGVSRLTP